MKTLAVDWGRAHIGLAISDEAGAWAFPRGEYAPDVAVTEMEKIIDREDVQYIIVGNPLPLSGAPGPVGEQQLQDVQRFATQLADRFPVGVELIDERFTNSPDAKAAYPDAGDHERAAAVLLQQYLSSRPS